MGPEELSRAKARARREARSRISELDGEERRASSEAICRHLTGILDGIEGTILLYAPLPGEPEISDLIEEFSAEKRAALPALHPSHGDPGDPGGPGGPEPLLLEAEGTARLVPSAKGFLQPETGSREVDPGEITAALVPGLAFDPSGMRLGRGGGYYDRLIPRIAGLVVGVAFSVQIIPKVPAGVSDRPVTLIVTEEGVMKRGGPPPRRP